jgi:hypothetical protein
MVRRFHGFPSRSTFEGRSIAVRGRRGRAPGRLAANDRRTRARAEAIGLWPPRKIRCRQRRVEPDRCRAPAFEAEIHYRMTMSPTQVRRSRSPRAGDVGPLDSGHSSPRSRATPGCYARTAPMTPPKRSALDTRTAGGRVRGALTSGSHSSGGSVSSSRTVTRSPARPRVVCLRSGYRVRRERSSGRPSQPASVDVSGREVSIDECHAEEAAGVGSMTGLRPEHGAEQLSVIARELREASR